jgi:hypothetical protein
MAGILNSLFYGFAPRGGAGSSSITGSGTPPFYAKFIGANSIGDALLSDDGTNVILPSGKFITSQNTTKIQMDFGTTGGEYFGVTTDGGDYLQSFIYIDGVTAEFALTPNVLIRIESASNAFQRLATNTWSIEDTSKKYIYNTLATTSQTASTESIGVNFNLSANRQWSTGAIATQREFLIQAPTYSFVGASTITNAATLAIGGAPTAGTNATISNTYAFWVQSGTSLFSDQIHVSGSTARAWVGLPSATNPDGNSTIRIITGSSTTTGVGLLSFVSNAGASTTQNLGGFNWANYAIGAAEKRVASISASLDGANNSGMILFGTWSAGSAAERWRISSSGNLSNTAANGTAYLHLKAGTATANTAPIKLTSGTNLTTAEAGAFEYNGADLFFTKSGTTRGTVLVATAVTTEAIVPDTSITITVNGASYKLDALAL